MKPSELPHSARRVKWLMRYVASAFICLILVIRVHAEAKFDFVTTPGKLPKEIKPVEYAIRIMPDL